jgi:hypothetical protein
MCQHPKWVTTRSKPRGKSATGDAGRARHCGGTAAAERWRTESSDEMSARERKHFADGVTRVKRLEGGARNKGVDGKTRAHLHTHSPLFAPNNCGWQTPRELADGTAIKMHAAWITAKTQRDGLGDGTLTAAQIARVVADVRLSDIVYADGDERLVYLPHQRSRQPPPPFLILRSKTSGRGALQILQRPSHVRN